MCVLTLSLWALSIESVVCPTETSRGESATGLDGEGGRAQSRCKPEAWSPAHAQLGAAKPWPSAGW